MSRSPFLDRQGAVASDTATGAPLHYGSPLAEQRALEDGRAVVDRSDLVVASIAGADRLSWVNSLSTQLLTGLEPEASTETLFLGPTGRIEHAARLVDDGERLWLILDAGDAEGLLAWLRSMVFMLRVEVEERRDLAVIGAFDGPAAAGIRPVGGSGTEVRWRDPWTTVAVGGHQYHQGEHPAAEYAAELVVVDAAEHARLAADSPVAGLLAWDALRIAAWRPEHGRDTDERSVPHELDWLRSAVHLTKGCYRGQETVAKVHNLGHPPRRLVFLDLDGSDGVLPAPGSDVVVVDEAGVRSVIGAVTSSALHHDAGPVALAVIKRSAPEGAPLVVAAEGLDLAAAQRVVVPATAGATADVPRLPRLGRRR
ncbi:CAF17-like 4Fe-4S cluster assembly/insertion protein YgfZ [Mycetocola reblochoni]|uniref:Folate-dependent protein for Fe/S cluster synthesis/repair in oxidative stress n=2 Tax=Mycetocola reblochoni TaxID=331618 RepID=A0A1R4JRC4_9MICO|nr:folate-binding protein YgfZ [Mycetocola reblochoni]RLP69302.1 folate-binding protein [Mycetocola reblochoni]SJN34335.1 Folate-dependent protein for Fe/S cluster synthesis/repair in oxidative stress [Mycetocola reblochoni REB411]